MVRCRSWFPRSGDANLIGHTFLNISTTIIIAHLVAKKDSSSTLTILTPIFLSTVLMHNRRPYPWPQLLRSILSWPGFWMSLCAKDKMIVKVHVVTFKVRIHACYNDYWLGQRSDFLTTSPALFVTVWHPQDEQVSDLQQSSACWNLCHPLTCLFLNVFGIPPRSGPERWRRGTRSHA